MQVVTSPSAWLLSTIAHVTAFGVMAFGPPPADERVAPPTVELTVATMTKDQLPPPLAPPPQAPPSAPALQPSPAKESAPTTKTSPERVLRIATAPVSQPASNEPLDLTATTLTSDHGDFAMPSGAGGAGGPVAARTSLAQPASAPIASPGLGPKLTRPEDLSRLPTPPDLGSALLAQYPARARALGETGRATLSLIVYEDGRVGGIEIRSASSEEFGRACRQTLVGSRWEPPVSKDGRRTATRVGYTCQFDVR